MSEVQMAYDANKKSVVVAYIIWFFLGGLGAHRMYAGRWTSAIIMLGIALVSAVLWLVALGWLTSWIIGLWWLIDVLLIPGMIRDYNNRLIIQLKGGL